MFEALIRLHCRVLPTFVLRCSRDDLLTCWKIVTPGAVHCVRQCRGSVSLVCIPVVSHQRFCSTNALMDTQLQDGRFVSSHEKRICFLLWTRSFLCITFGTDRQFIGQSAKSLCSVLIVFCTLISEVY